ncbi:MAG: (Fe-S)-binding protein [Chitinophagales bacterium]|nr:(Fe-S)-binding protein [Chitinophagales bacterium]MDW8428161.1 (Fe-S)-binding protein [Chitinophagales bacterium]
MLQQIVFALVLGVSVFLAVRNARIIVRNIKLGRKEQINGRKQDRWMQVLRVALGQSKMFVRPIPAVFHLIIYLGFLIINTEILEILIDGLAGTHRVFSYIFPSTLYGILIAVYEVLALGTIIAAAIFLIRRHVLRLPRFASSDLDGWPRRDAAVILVFEIALMIFFLTMNGADRLLQQRGFYAEAGWFPISSWLVSPLLEGYSLSALFIVERAGWWLHIVGVFAFLNYLIWSKHLHIILSFPNVYFSRLEPQGQMTDMPQVTREVQLMLNLTSEPSAANGAPFGAKDIFDLSWKQLLDAYSCTECGRCTSVCPASITGKKLSPRLIMMKTRDRMEEVGRYLDRNLPLYRMPALTARHEAPPDSKPLLGGYITEEELWACTTCNACVQECPINISPLSIIVDLRRALVMEEARLPNELTQMNRNLENNGAPWQFGQQDRLNWAEGLHIPTVAELAAQGRVPEVLFWVGCSGSFDERNKKVTQALAVILSAANISYAVLGTEENCTGDPARRAGNEFLFQMIALQNIQLLNAYNIKKIVTACPHCFNTLRNEYRGLGGTYEVMHHSQLLQQLLLEGRVRVRDQHHWQGKTVSYHDSCYLGRGNGVFEAPRAVLQALGMELRELKRCRQNGLCCGAGGAQMFKEEEAGTHRVNAERAAEVLEARPDAVAVACPFCMTMLDDGLRQKAHDHMPPLRDVAEYVAEACEQTSPTK